jgi:hypothetical protein
MGKCRIALIACSNGYGHVRRMLSIANALIVAGARPVLFAPQNVAEKLACNYSVSLPEVVDFDSMTNRKSLLDGGAATWVSRLPMLDDFDVVVSDNLLEILTVRPDAWLSGSFFWHRTLEGYPVDLAVQAEDLLRQLRPRMIASSFFAADYLKFSTKLHMVGLYALGKRPARPKTDALISSGRGGGAEAATKSLIKVLRGQERPPFATVWIEPSVYSSDLPDWIRPADFTREMFATISAAVIRPGVGTVTDALLSGARIFAFYENGNHEMLNNAARIQIGGLGVAYKEPIDAWTAAIAYMFDHGDRIAHSKVALAQNIEGATEAARILMKT